MWYQVPVGTVPVSGQVLDPELDTAVKELLAKLKKFQMRVHQQDPHKVGTLCFGRIGCILVLTQY